MSPLKILGYYNSGKHLIIHLRCQLIDVSCKIDRYSERERERERERDFKSQFLFSLHFFFRQDNWNFRANFAHNYRVDVREPSCM